MAQDRSDVQHAVKELSRKMSKPNRGDMRQLKRFGRYLIGKPRMRCIMRYQAKPDKLDIWGDTDFAGCVRTRKSTTGGVAVLGSHTIKTWSLAQSIVALSSGEAEYYGLVKDASIGLGLRNMLRDLGVDLSIELSTDATAAKGIASRKGIGKVRHTEVNQLWLQDKVRNGEITVNRVAGDKNIADALTKSVDSAQLILHAEKTNLRPEKGRHELCPSQEECSKVSQDNSPPEDDEQDGAWW